MLVAFTLTADRSAMELARVWCLSPPAPVAACTNAGSVGYSALSSIACTFCRASLRSNFREACEYAVGQFTWPLASMLNTK
eukprot:6212976-Pleurochrysis_carterae.AAC.3